MREDSGIETRDLALLVSQACTEFAVPRKRGGFVLMLDPGGQHLFRRRVTVPHYEEARRYFKEAAADGQDVNPEKFTEERLRAIVKAFGE